MFGTANQLLAAIALTVGTSFIMNLFYPMLFVPKTQLQGTINLLLTVVIMGSVVVIMIDAVPKWIAVMRNKREPENFE